MGKGSESTGASQNPSKPEGCYTGECQPGEKCIWGCALWNHWARLRAERNQQ